MLVKAGMPGEWPRVTFEHSDAQPAVIGFCTKCGAIGVYPASAVLPLKHSDLWYHRCDQWHGGKKCAGMVQPPQAREDEEALVSAYLVGGWEAAKNLWKEIRRKERRRAAQAMTRAGRKKPG